jgi:hypothetical protein
MAIAAGCAALLWGGRMSGIGLRSLLAQEASASAPAVAAGQGKVIVLDTTGFWRMCHVMGPPVVRTDSGLKPLLLGASWVDGETPSPPAQWTEPGFDDHRWARGPARLACLTPYLARLCLRGKFTVTDLTKVRDLALTVSFHGGAIAYVNGQEVARAHVPPGAPGLAEDYPGDVFLTKRGALLGFEARKELKEGDPRREGIRRTLADVSIPARLLRPGVNVVAVEILRAPYPAVVDEKKDAKKGFWNFAWNTCQVDEIRLTASAAEGLVPNAVRPAEFQVWNSNLLASDYDLDFGDPTETLCPIEIVGARNGSFSGKAVVGSPKLILNLKATAGDLKGPGGTIPASQVRIRYGLPWGADYLVVPYGGYPSPYPAEPGLLGCLSDCAPEEVPVRQKKPRQWDTKAPGQPEPVPGAVVPVWVTVSVPMDARPGTYSGSVTIEAEGQKPVAVPLQLKVADWTLPDPQDYRTWVEIIQSPDTLALEYGVPLWSEQHWDLVAESFRLLSGSGSRVVYIPLIAETNLGHGQTMVRWIKKGEGRYEHDFSVMERYLDLAEKDLGKPKIVLFYVWDVYMLEKGKGGAGANQSEQENLLKGLEEKGVLLGRGPVVTAIEPPTGEAQNVVLPPYTDPASKGLWEPLFVELRQRMARRGLEKAMMLGMITDAWPTREQVAFLSEVAPDIPWAAHAHFGATSATVYQLGKIAYQLRVWAIEAPSAKSLMGWKQPDLMARYFRALSFNDYPSAMWRQMCEFAITGDQRGVGRLGGEYWEVIKDRTGRRQGRVYARYPQSNWRNLDVYTSLLAPGPRGPAATHHYEHLREGIQECEARIVIERALADQTLKARLGEDLVRRCADALEERLRRVQLCFCQLINRLDADPAQISSTGGPGIAGHFWYVGSGWEDRAEKLFTLAGEVERKLAPESDQ